MAKEGPEPAPASLTKFSSKRQFTPDELVATGLPESPARVILSELVKRVKRADSTVPHDDFFTASLWEPDVVRGVATSDLEILLGGVPEGVEPTFITDSSVPAIDRFPEIERVLLEKAWEELRRRKEKGGSEIDKIDGAPAGEPLGSILESVGQRANEALERDAMRECGLDRTTMHLLLYNLSAKVDSDPEVIECVRVLDKKKKDAGSVNQLVYVLEQKLNEARRAAAERLVSEFVNHLSEEQLTAIFSNTVDNATIWYNFQTNLRSDVVKEVLWHAAHKRYNDQLGSGNIWPD